MDKLQNVLLVLDPWLIKPFRWPESPLAGYFLGIFILGLICVLLGDVAAILVSRLNRKVYGGYIKDMVHHHEMSIEAAKTGNKAHFKAVNRQAHESFGRYFFSQAAVFTASIWPLPFALAWLDMRFRDALVRLPFLDYDANYVFFFIPLYIVARLIYSRSIGRMPWYLRLRMAAILEEAAKPGPSGD